MTFTIPNSFANAGTGNPPPAPGLVTTSTARLDENFTYIADALNTLQATMASNYAALSATIPNRVPVSAFGAYGTSDDTLTWESALASGEALWAPAGIISPVSTLALPNACNILGSRGQSIIKSLADGLPTFTLSDPYNTFVTVHDLILRGDLGGSQPATGTHRGVYFENAFSGIDDAQYVSNSPMGAQTPRHSLKLSIKGYQDEGVYLIGAGDNEYWFEVFACNGVGIRSNSYDNRFYDPNVGGSGLQNWLFEGNGSSTTVVGGKTWYSGQAGVSGQSAGIHVKDGGSVVIMGHQIQDSSGSSLILEGATADENVCVFIGQIQYQGTPNYFDPAATAAIDLRGSTSNLISAQVSVTNVSQMPTYLISNIANGMIPAGENNVINISPYGFEVSDSMLNFVNGTLDQNIVNIGKFRRASRWLAGDDGDASFGLEADQAATGFTLRGKNSLVAAGQLALVGQAGGMTLAGFTNAAVYATGTYTGVTNFANGDHVDIAGTTYTMSTGTFTFASAANLVKIGANLAASLTNLYHATNRLGGVPGTDYSLATQFNPAVAATTLTGITIVVTARSIGAGGNALVSTTTSTHGSWGAATLTGGANGAQTYADALTVNADGSSLRPYLQASTSYANDGAAAGGGVPVEGEYRNGSVEQVRIA